MAANLAFGYPGNGDVPVPILTAFESLTISGTAARSQRTINGREIVTVQAIDEAVNFIVSNATDDLDATAGAGGGFYLAAGDRQTVELPQGHYISAIAY